MSDQPEPVGFIGLGQIGAPMARRLLAWPGGLMVHDVDAAATQAFADAGAQVADSPAEVAASCSVISVMVRDDAQVAQVLTGPDGVLATARPGTVVAIHSTVRADTPAEMATLAAASGVDVIDAPVSGGAMGAHGGTLALMVGGTEAAVAKVREPFALLATLVAHLGPIGAGTRAKLARNLITFSSMVAVGEASRLAVESGVDLQALGQVVRHSDQVTGGPGAIMLRAESGPLAENDGLHAIFSHTRDLGEKDLALALDLAAALDLDLPMTSLALTNLGDALGVGPGPTATDPEETP